MKIDFSLLKEPLNHMAFQLAIILCVPLVAGLIAKWIFRAIKFPNSVANFLAIWILLFVLYKTIIIVLG